MEHWLLSEEVDIVDHFERTLADLGLQYQRLTLKKYKDCIHWHIRLLGSTGTLEATYLKETHKLWLDIRAGREAPWQQPVVAELESLFKNEGDLFRKDTL